MKKVIFIIALFLGFTGSFAQGVQNMTVKQTREAQYALGDAAVDQYFFDNLHYSDEAKHAKVDTEVMLSFMVEKDSTISTIKVIRDPGFGIGDRLKELLSRMKYIPAMENGVMMRSKVILNVPVRAH
jgi:hypothetical protein